MKTKERKEKELRKIEHIYNFSRNFPDRKIGEITSSLYELDTTKHQSTLKRMITKMYNSPIPYLLKVDINNGKGKYRINQFGSPNKDDNVKFLMELRKRGPFNLKNYWKRYLELIEKHNNVSLSLEAITGIYFYLTIIGNQSYFIKKNDFTHFLEGFCLLHLIFNQDIAVKNKGILEYSFEGLKLDFKDFIYRQVSRYPDTLEYLNTLNL